MDTDEEAAARTERARRLCELANNSTQPPPGAHCPGTFDGWLCWGPAAAGEALAAPCPDFVPGFSSDLLAHKQCSADGEWFRHPESGRPWSNYTTCVRPEDDVSDIIAVYEAGYGLSLLALLLSLAVLLYFKALRCARITVHMNLFAAFALNNGVWLAWYALVVRAPDVLAASPAWCRALLVLRQYALLATYTWMLCEGLYLHTVLVAAFVAERRLLRALLALGWALPLPCVAAMTWMRAAAHERYCWLDETPRPELYVPVAVVVLLNVGFLCNIVRVLCTKLRATPRAAPPRTALQALRATCLLAPLLGLQYALLPARPGRGSRYWLLYEYVAALAASLQGLAVAALYCFCNAEVLAQLRRRWRALTFRPRANSATNTTVSFVRSAGGGGGEEKV